MIYLLRHGQTDWNIIHRIQGHLDIPLNDTGKDEAKTCAHKLIGIKMDQIISSDLSRARETAEIINEFLSAPFSVDQRLREINFGDLQGVLVKDVSAEMWDHFNHAAHKLHAETLPDVYRRIKSFFDEIDPQKNTLIVAHGGVIRMAVYLAHSPSTFNQAEYEEKFLEFKIKNTQIFTWNKSDLIQPLF